MTSSLWLIQKNIGAITSDPVFYNKSETNNFESITCILWPLKKNSEFDQNIIMPMLSLTDGRTRSMKTWSNRGIITEFDFWCQGNDGIVWFLIIYQKWSFHYLTTVNIYLQNKYSIQVKLLFPNDIISFCQKSEMYHPDNLNIYSIKGTLNKSQMV